MTKFKRLTAFVIAFLMAITFMAQPLVVLADTYGTPEDGYQNEDATDYDYYVGDDYPADEYPADDEYPANEYPVDEHPEDVEYPEHEYPVDEDPILAARVALFEMLYDMLPEITRFVHLTEEAREIALYDFDYFAEYMLATIPTRHIFYRLVGLTVEEYLAGLRHMIYDMVPVPSFTAADMGERWADEPTDALMIAADYMYTLLHLFIFELGGFGHFGPQGTFVVEHTFFTVAFSLYHGPPVLDDESIQMLEEMGFDVDWLLAADHQFSQFHYDVLSTPSVQWFYELDASEFDFYVDFLGEVGAMNENNITTHIIEPGRIAYIHIASFFNNMIMDSEVLFPFYEEIQDFEHLILDIRGNGGGMVGHFPLLVVSMLGVLLII
ncbi:MAG: S41 family peptidase [Defluviitaleaceae bacterium]|nr:S41 family peptidase [Defluviitaleaceae bacterium]